MRVWRWHQASGTRKLLLDGVSWTVRAGERWALLGPNGAGKTTLLTLAGAAGFPSSGTVEILGETMGRTDVARLRRQIGFVDARDGDRFAPLLTVREVVRTGRDRDDRLLRGAARACSTSTAPTRCSAAFGLGAPRRAPVRRLLRRASASGP